MGYVKRLRPSIHFLATLHLFLTLFYLPIQLGIKLNLSDLQAGQHLVYLSLMARAQVLLSHSSLTYPYGVYAPSQSVKVVCQLIRWPLMVLPESFQELQLEVLIRRVFLRIQEDRQDLHSPLFSSISYSVLLILQLLQSLPKACPIHLISISVADILRIHHQ